MADYINLAKEIVSELDEERLIHAVKKWRCLYAPIDPDFQNYNVHRSAWNDIAQQCNKKVGECVNHWYSLLQTYYNTKKDSNWPHFKLLKDFEPYLSNPIPIKAQRDELIKELLNHSDKLRSPESTMEHRQIIWSIIVSKCNGITNGTFLPILRWQKFWYTLKQHFGLHWLKLQSNHQAIDASKFSIEELRILKICGANQNGSYQDIISALFSNIELGTDREFVIPKCSNCLQQKNELLINGTCESCRKRPGAKCDKCHQFHCPDGLMLFRTTHWSSDAKELLPKELLSSNEIFLCVPCSNSLQTQATIAWKVCRICESNHTSLDYIYSSSNGYLRKVFKEATTISLNETDGLPGYLCTVCKVQVQQFNNFYLKITRAQGRLRHLHAVSFIGPMVKKLPNPIGRVNNPPQRFKNNSSFLIAANSVESPKPRPAESILKTPAGVQQFKRVYIKKQNVSPATSKVLLKEPLNNVTPQAASTSKITIKDIFSLKEGSVVAAPVNNKESIHPMPLKPDTVKKIFSNNDVTITRRVCEQPQTDNSHIIPSLQQSKDLAPTPKTGITITKRIGVGSGLQSRMNQFALQTEPGKVFTNSGTGSPLPIKNASSCKETVRLPTNTIQTTSKPAIFTIPGTDFDYETIEDAPPVFCIPKNADRSLPIDDNTKPFNVEDVLPSTVQTNVPVIKKEIVDTEYPSVEPDTSVNRLQVSEPITVPAAKCTNSKESPIPSNTKMIRLNGSRVFVKPHPYITGGYVQVGSMIPQQTQPVNSGSGGRYVSTYIRKVVDSESKVQNNSIVMTPDQQHRLQQNQQGIKKARKYWGTVDEFQITQQPTPTTQPAKILPTTPAEAVPVSMQRSQMTATTLPRWSGTKSDTLTDPLHTPTIDTSINVKIKQEIPDVDDEPSLVSSVLEKTTETNPSMFYPDSIELENVALSADVSLMINNFMISKNSMGGDTMNSYIDPSFLFPYAGNQLPGKPESKKDDKTKDRENVEETSNEIEKLTTNGDKTIKIPPNAKLKKLRVKLKRHSKLRAMLSGPKIMCTNNLQQPSTFSSSGLRKSLRNCKI